MITLRLGKHHVNMQDAVALKDAISRHEKCCDTVWFSTLYGYPPLEAHEQQAEKMIKAAEIFRKAGIRVSMQIANTLGHGEYMKTKDNSGLIYENSPAEHMVGAQGEKAGYCFCWRGEHFRKYMEDALALYAQMKPEVVWFDDDLRPYKHTPVKYGCYCEHCISEFNKLYGVQFDRETLVYEINYGDVLWRQRYIDFCRKGIAELVSIIIKSIMKISSETRFGLQCCYGRNYMGNNLDYILDAIKEVSGQPPLTRPGEGYYHDKMPLEQFKKAKVLEFCNSIMPDYVVDKKAEVENLPDVVFGKSIGGTITESTLHLACGCTGLTYATLMNEHEPLEWHEKMLHRFSEIRPYWEKLSYISKHAHQSGLRIFKGESPHSKVLTAGEEPFSWTDIAYQTNIKLFTIGIPVTHDKRGDGPYLLHHEMIDYLTDNDIEFLLTQPVLTDAASVKKIYDRGFAKRLHLNLTPLTVTAYERFTDHAINGTAAGRRFAESSFFAVGMTKYLVDGTDGGTVVLGEVIKGITEECLGGATVITQTYDKNGGRSSQWAVFGYCVWNDIVSAAKRNQILNAVDYLKPFSAKLISAEQAAVIPAVDESGNTVAVTIASASIGGTEDLTVLIRKPAGERMAMMSSSNRVLEPLERVRQNGELCIELPALQPYEIVTVFFES